MNERRTPQDESALPPDPPRFPKDPRPNHDARPETLANKTKVTPLDEDNNLKDGIEVKET
jgi:hypothetical protein